MIIGITGKSGSGKNYVAQKLFPRALHVDIDTIGHAAIQEPTIITQLFEAFGHDIMNGDPFRICRKKLGQIVFSDRDAHEKLKDITWPFMRNQIILYFNGYHNSSVDYDLVLNWVLLPLVEFWDMCELKILVVRNDDNRFQSLQQRDGITEERMHLRDQNAPQFENYNYDFIILNEK